jgi:nucleoside-diphosphate-sugar epimerase
MSRPVVLVTGAGGFIGSVVVTHLSAAGFSVRAGVRRMDPDRPDHVRCNLDRDDEVRAAVAGVDAVVHAAYGDSAAMPGQCARLLAAMAAGGVASLIHFSSIAIFGALGGDLDEQHPPGPPLDAYAGAKIACESQVRNWASDAASETRRAVLLRPGIVYGAGSPFWIEKMGERIRREAWGTFGAAGEGDAALIHVDDLAALVTAALTRLIGPERMTLPQAATVHAVGPDVVSWNQYFNALAAAMGRPALADISPATLAMRQGLAIGAKVWRRLGLPGGESAALAPLPGEMALFGRKANYRTDTALRLFGTLPKIGLAEGLARSVGQEKA